MTLYVLVVALLFSCLWLLLTWPVAGITWERIAVAGSTSLGFAVVTLWLIRRIAARRP
ncbi:MAG: hypothetical protein AB7R89_19765 [Dehalococcoidia bacterium]